MWWALYLSTKRRTRQERISPLRYCNITFQILHDRIPACWVRVCIWSHISWTGRHYFGNSQCCCPGELTFSNFTTVSSLSCILPTLPVYLRQKTLNCQGKYTKKFNWFTIKKFDWFELSRSWTNVSFFLFFFRFSASSWHFSMNGCSIQSAIAGRILPSALYLPSVLRSLRPSGPTFVDKPLRTRAKL